MAADPEAGHGQAQQRALIDALRDPRCFPHEVERICVLETHISYVILTGRYAYKIKKAVDLGFLDFTTLERRRFFCEEELRLNVRTAPDLYLRVVPVCGSVQAPRIGADGEAIEYAVTMREFPQDALADRLLARGQFTAEHVDSLAGEIAGFHRAALRAQENDPWGAPVTVAADAAQNFSQMRAAGVPAASMEALDRLEAWSLQEHARLRDVFAQRKREGAVRECHGDLHLGNIALLDGQPRIFDCVEFNPAFRWIDVMNEIAFPVMDLHAGGRADLAARLLDAWLERTGDYGGLRVLRYYVVYRAMVRAKVARMRARQMDRAAPDSADLEQKVHRYLTLAEEQARATGRFVVLAHGLSGSGKTTLSQTLLELTGAVRIRSDVERKRMRGLEARARTGADVGRGLYAAGATEATYARLLEIAAAIVDAGYGVIVDATFLHYEQRARFRALADGAGARFLIIDFQADEALLRERVVERGRSGEDASDAGLAVLAHQIAGREPLRAEERALTTVFDASMPLEQARRPQAWAEALRRLGMAR
jgi:aminoglycoside phosphotransferase family enzyme/predicted kinase